MDKINVCIVSFIIAEAFETPLNNLKKLLSSLSKNLYLLTGKIEKKNSINKEGNIVNINIKYQRKSNIFLEGINYFLMQLKISKQILKLSKNTDFFVFFMEGVGIFPMLASKICGKKILWMVPSSILAVDRERFNLIFKLLKDFSSRLSNKIILYSPNLVKHWNLEKYRFKIAYANEHFIDFEKFKIMKEIDKRDNTIGHISRLSKEKGSEKFAKSIPKIINKSNNVNFLIGGDGDLKKGIEKIIKENNLQNRVKIPGWVSREKLPKQLNELKLIVLPSYTEGLPNIMLEAMACGTPVLASSVGSIPDLIKNDKNGFLLENNSEENISKKINEILNKSDLNKISREARLLIEKEFTYKKTLSKFKKIFDDLLN